MSSLPHHVENNRTLWARLSKDFDEPGRRAWASGVIDWGVWNVPEEEVHALGDLSLLNGKDTVELGCGTGYVSSWLARLGARPVGVDITPEQLANARKYQREFGIQFPLYEESAEETSLPSESFDYAVSEYGASIWCDPKKWIPEAARLLRPGGRLVFLRNSTISVLCSPQEGAAKPELVNDYRKIERMDWDDGIEFHMPTGDMLRLLRASGFDVVDFIELFPRADTPPTRFEYIDLEWSHRWPAEEMWCAVKR
ncbi:class I SAM-dependent methyltransferase [Fimbriimonas ginsengisoli]|uniref:Type 11 methyltransferase n=1 Tax=Fimbriimonas ginsengisoli Gsoil 348 TaxID=661478 RepID=A0A068NV94_FIMGI|nr:class I SAM-dependent methyltransferase [Fimbriimonas ginsengisoli]AIE87292.1 type 11 methyltransferase [Fimbriimonas ginsengisoli Gsoil 348]